MLMLSIFLVIFVGVDGIEVWPKRTLVDACTKYREVLRPKKVIEIGVEVDGRFWQFTMDEVGCKEVSE